MSSDRMAPSERPYEEILDRQIEEGHAEINRTSVGILVSALTAGLYIGFGPLLMVEVESLATGVYSHATTQFLLALMYSVGFVFVVISQTDLFTELDTRAMFPVMKRVSSAIQLFRLWALVIVGNVIGGVIFSIVLVHVALNYGIVEPNAFAELATLYTTKTTWQLFLGAIVAGWLMGLTSWLVVGASGTGSSTLFVVMTTGTIALLHLPHAIAGNVEVFMGLLVDSPVSWFDYGRFLASTLVGNAIGGVVFVAGLTYIGRPRNNDG